MQLTTPTEQAPVVAVADAATTAPLPTTVQRLFPVVEEVPAPAPVTVAELVSVATTAPSAPVVSPPAAVLAESAPVEQADQVGSPRPRVEGNRDVHQPREHHHPSRHPSPSESPTPFPQPSPSAPPPPPPSSSPTPQEQGHHGKHHDPGDNRGHGHRDVKWGAR